MAQSWRERATTVFHCEKQPGVGSRGMVVSNHPLASAAGAEVLLGGGNARLSGPLDELIAAHYVLIGDGDPSDVVGAGAVIHTEKGVRSNSHVVEGVRPSPRDGWVIDDATLDDVVLGHLSAETMVAA